MPKSTRTFIALPIPEPIGRKLTHLQEKLAKGIAGVRWVESTGFHVTLNFLGEVIDTDLHLVCKQVIDVAQVVEPFEATMKGVGAFPYPSRPRVIWAGIEDDHGLLASIHHDLAIALATIGYHSEEPRFHPHVTLGRIRSDRGPSVDLTPVVELNRAWSGGSFRCRELVIFASNFGATGPVYTALGRAPLRGRKMGPNA